MAVTDVTEKNRKMREELDQFKSEAAQIANDMINHPPHYNSSLAKCECGRRIECIDITRHMSFNLGNSLKYLWRWQDKGGIEDLRKARWYLEDAIKDMEKRNADK